MLYALRYNIVTTAILTRQELFCEKESYACSLWSNKCHSQRIFIQDNLSVQSTNINRFLILFIQWLKVDITKIFHKFDKVRKKSSKYPTTMAKQMWGTHKKAEKLFLLVIIFYPVGRINPEAPGQNLWRVSTMARCCKSAYRDSFRNRTKVAVWIWDLLF